MKDLIPVLNQEMDRIMEYLEGKRARVQFDEDMSLIISNWETGDPTTYRKISGGMKKRVNIAIACAFRETIRAASGCNPSLFIVDESADSLDTPGKLGFVSLLQSMAQDSTIWVITHDKVLRPALDEVASGNIHIEMCGGVSRVFTTHY
jgi:ABC-type multidrug transport system ATPase subunit